MSGKDLVGGIQKILTRLFFLDILIRFPDTLNLKRHVNCECPVKEDLDRKKSEIWRDQFPLAALKNFITVSFEHFC